MPPRTAETLKKLQQAQWFRAVGVRDTQVAEVLTSWDEATKSCGSAEWQDLILEAANQYRERLVERSRERFQLWNTIALGLKPITQALVDAKIEQVIEQNGLPKVFKDTVNWDVLLLCMEAEYADVYQPGFFASQAYWYVKGHFPCGWQGDFPKGMLIIY
jgi:hypothetical protein